MTSPLEQRIVRQIATEPDIGRRAAHLAVLACYFARTGELDKADAIRIELRSKFGDGNFPRVSILLMLLEGLLIYFNNLDLAGKDRIIRAKLIGKFVLEKDLVSLTSAWLAHIHFNQSNWVEMKNEISSVFENISSDDGSALCRVALVLGNTFLYTNQPSKSKAWYATARSSATALGDRSAIGAITYNNAVFGLQNLRLVDGDKPSMPKGIALIKTLVDTAMNYESLVQLRSLSELATIMRCGVDVLQRDFVKASLGIDKFFGEIEFNSNNSQHIRLAADMSWCLAVCGDNKSSEKWQDRAVDGRESLTDLDDQAITYFSLARASSARGDDKIAHEQRSLAKSKHAAHKRALSKVVSAIDEFSDPKRLIQSNV